MIIFQKQPNRDFTILNISDPQLTNSDWNDGYQNRRILEYTIEELITRVKPDLITVSGDISYPEQLHAYKMFADTIEKYNIPWAVVWGNHDQEVGGEYIKKFGGLEGLEWIEKVENLYATYPHFIYERGDLSLGRGNYVIAIQENEKIVEALIMMDTHEEEPYINENGCEQMTWSKLTKAQIAWLQAQTQGLQAQGCKDATLVIHIPIYAYRLASQAAYKEGVCHAELTLQEAEGIECWNKGYEESIGVQHEPNGVCSYPVDDGVFTAIKQDGLIRQVIAGHDHINNWIIRYDGVTMVYALTTGAGCYWDPAISGGTVIKINQDGVYKICHEYVDASHIWK